MYLLGFESTSRLCPINLTNTNLSITFDSIVKLSRQTGIDHIQNHTKIFFKFSNTRSGETVVKQAGLI